MKSGRLMGRMVLAILAATAQTAFAQGGEERIWVLFPRTVIYPSYVADPRQPRTALTSMTMLRRTTPRTSRRWLETSFGDTLPLLRIHKKGRPDRGFQVQAAGAIFAQWDNGNYQDGIGWDGFYSLVGTWTAGERTAFRAGIRHKSSHITDEYMQNTGRTRINYTRDEFLAGVSRRLRKNLRSYSEVGAAYHRLSPAQKTLRLQSGLEYESPPILMGGLAGLYFALDLQTHEENSWNLSAAVQAGIVLPLAGTQRRLRLGLEYYDGRSPLGEFFLDRDRHLSFGFWLTF